MKINGIKKLKQTLKSLQPKDKQVKVVVGFTAAYAVHVHENVGMAWRGLPRGAGFTKSKDGVVIFDPSVLVEGSIDTGEGKGFYWGPHGQAKFLEEPARRLSGDLAKIIRRVYKQTKNPEQALTVAGLRLQREAQELVPIDTGNLKASAFTRKET